MSDNRRRHERYNVYAQVELAHDGELVLLPVRNLSIGGAFVEAPIGDYPKIKVGSRFELSLSIGDDEGGEEESTLPSVSCRCFGKVARRERSNPPGFALIFEQLSPAELKNLRELIAAAPKR
jgi:hypothetical protein